MRVARCIQRRVTAVAATLGLLALVPALSMPLGAQGGPPPFMGVVTPKGAPQNIDLSTVDRTLNFSLLNTGAQAGAGFFTVRCTGPLAGCSSSPSSVNTAANTPVTVHYHSTGVAGTGRVTLVFTPQQAPYAQDSGWFNITIAPPPPPTGITVVGAPSSVTLPGGRADQAVNFTVTNDGNQDTRVLLRGTCSGAPLVAVCASTVSEVYARAHESVPARVNVTTMPGGGSGSTVTLITSDPTSGTDWSSANVSVAVTSAPAAIVTVKTFQAGPNVEKGLCPTFALAAAVASQCGAARIIHALPSVRTYGKSYAPTLAYYQDNMEGNDILVDVALAPSTPTPSQVRVLVYAVSADGTRGGVVADKSYAGSEWASRTTRRVNIRFLPASNYVLTKYDVEVMLNGGSGWVTAAPIIRGEMIQVGRNQYWGGGGDAWFGNGWGLLGLERLMPNQYGDIVTWVGGDGSTRKYTPVQTIAGTTAFVTLGFFRPDSLYRLSDGTFRRPLRHGASVLFDALGRHTSTVDRHGRATQFGYEPTGIDQGRLHTITVPGNLTYVFDYSAAELTITAPGGRIVRVQRTAPGTQGIAAIVDPDGSTERFYYADPWGTNWAVIYYTDKRGTQSLINWEGYGETMSQFVPLAPGNTPLATTTLASVFGRNASPGDGSSDASLPDYIVDGPRTNVSDVMQVWTDSLGVITRSMDGTGTVMTTEHGDPRFPGLATKLTNGRNNFETRASYDARGHVAAQTAINPHDDGKNATVVYTWDATWDEITRITTAEGIVSTFGVDATTGNRLWEENPNLAGTRTSYDYDPDRMLRAIRHPTIAGVTPTTSIGYSWDGLNNPILVVSPKGYRTRYSTDGLGRVTATAQQITPGDNTTMQLDSTVYDVMDRVTEELHYGPALANGGVAPTGVSYVRVFHDYYPNGDLSAIRRYPLDGQVGLLTTAYRYDALGRLTAEVAPDGKVDSTAYDEAGNAKAHVTRNVDVINMTYDVLNRPLTKTVPARSYGAHPSMICAIDCQDDPNAVYPQFDLSPAGHLTIAGETATFTYDPATGAIQTASNPTAVVTRTYYRNGDLRTEAQHIRTVVPGTIDPNVHDYTMTYSYDRDGRLTALQLPPVLYPTTGAGAVLGTSIGYTYDPLTGALATVRDAMGNVTTAQYNTRGERTLTALPGASRTETYDDDGQLSTSYARLGTGGAVLRSNTMTYDARGKMLSMIGAAGPRETITSWYSGLGHLVRSHNDSRDQSGANQTVNTDETFTLSALGDMLGGSTTTNYRYQSGGGFNSSGGTTLQTTYRTYTYDPQSGRLQSQNDGGRSDTFEYDLAGSTTFMRALGSSQNRVGEERASYYNADGQLRVTESRSVGDFLAVNNRRFRQVFEEYGYDAIGRRVLVRTRKVCMDETSQNVSFCGVGMVRRTIWDGGAELAEIQQPGGNAASPAEMENDGALTVRQTSPLGDYYNPNPFFGTVVYAYGMNGTDEPVTVTRLHYRDWTSTTLAAFDPYAITPLWNPVGRIDAGVFAGGAPTVPGTNASIRIAFPDGWFAYYRSLYTPWSWHGSLIEDKRDGSGLHYRRNRSYDPMTGRFTQEDPIGLAGGLNVYGFANGDPVNFSDPFGLTACKYYEVECLSDELTAWGGGTGAAGRVLVPSVLTAVSFFGLDAAENDAAAAAKGSKVAAASLGASFVFAAIPGGSGARKAENLAEQMAMDAAKSGLGREIMAGKIKDVTKAGMAKMEVVATNKKGEALAIVHYWMDRATGELSGFKFK